MARERVFDGNIPKTVDGVNRFVNALHFAIHSMINAVPLIRVVVNVKSESQSIGEVLFFNKRHHLFQFFLLHHDRDAHRATNQTDQKEEDPCHLSRRWGKKNKRSVLEISKVFKRYEV